jgi:RNA polymerase sigma-70 factor (ECF subfamily)
VCPTTEDAEDAVQETLLVATRHLSTFRRAAAITTWLFAIVRNFCLRLDLRQRRFVELEPLAPMLADTQREPDDQAGSRELSELLAKGLSALPPQHRQVLLLRDVRGLSAPEAASELGMSVSALKSQLHRARAALRRQVELQLS